MSVLLKVVRGNSCPDLAEKICARLAVIETPSTVKKFKNNETNVQIEASVRGADVYVVQSGIGEVCANDAVMELLILINACKIASAQRVIGVLPYFPYGKQSKMKKRGAIPAKLVSIMLSRAGVDQIITLDLTPSQMVGFFDCPLNNVATTPLLTEYIKDNIPEYKDGVIVAKNAGASKRAADFANILGVSVALVMRGSLVAEDQEGEDEGAPGSPGRSRRRTASSSDTLHKQAVATSTTKTVNVIGSVKDRLCILVDDVIDNTKAFITAAEALRANGAEKVVVVCTHGVLSGSSLEEIEASCIDQVIVTDSISQKGRQERTAKLKVVSCHGVLAEVIRRVHNGESTASTNMSMMDVA